MCSGARAVTAICVAWAAAAIRPAPAWAQTSGLEAPSLWLLLVSLAQIVGAAALIVFFITRNRTRSCPRCGQKLARDRGECPRCGTDPRRSPGQRGAGS